MTIIDLSTIGSGGRRMHDAGRMLDAMVAGARDVVAEGADRLTQFVVLAEGNADMPPELVLDVLAVALGRLAEVPDARH